ncbi:MAG TPA: hypothetical protein VFX76_16430, partial [Roseiflexaceae bacterium]|nr:hypothetical protein [Roseiflexaceae bacterium]
FAPRRLVGREMLPFLFALPGMRGLAYRGWVSRPFVDWLFNRLGLARRGYRLFWECAKQKERFDAAARS